ncbi:MAG: nucleotide exchange factor GrpE [Clostridia bacterium]|nr:nucleotide exchange factor GrpE [Clostridia bacterium]
MEERKQAADTEETVAEEMMAEQNASAAETKVSEPEGEQTEACSEESTCGEKDKEPEEKLSGKDKKKLKKAESEIARLEKELAAKERELAERNDQYLRLMAEYENFRKRSTKEKESIYTDAYVDALTQILPILDNLDRAAEYGQEDPEAPMAKGVELTRKSFVEVLAKMGVTEIEAQGCPFDPNVHNAVMHVEDETVGENTVVEVFMKGYIKGDKVLRYSMVKVANYRGLHKSKFKFTTITIKQSIKTSQRRKRKWERLSV